MKTSSLNWHVARNTNASYDLEAIQRNSSPAAAVQNMKGSVLDFANFAQVDFAFTIRARSSK